MAIASVILHTIIVIIAVLLIGLVLIQPSKGGGFGSAFGGVGESVFGAQAMSHLSKLTIVLMSVFFALTLVLAVLAGHKRKPEGLVEKMASAGTAAAAKAPAAPVLPEAPSLSANPAQPAPAAKEAPKAVESKEAPKAPVEEKPSATK